MRLNIFFLLASFFLFSTNISFADVTISYGEGAGKVDFVNTNKYAEYEDPLPLGPLSFRIVGDKTWVADTVGGKLMQFDNKGKLISEFSVLPIGVKPYELDEEGFPTPNIIIDDIAPVLGQYGDLEAWWVVDSNENKLLKFSADGKPLAQLQDPDYSKLFRVEVGVSGHLFVADKGNRKIYIYDSNGNFISEQNWEGSGMAVAGKEDNLYKLIYFNEENRYILVTTNVNGKVIRSKALDVEMLNPELWWVDDLKGEAVITYIPLTAFESDIKRKDIEDLIATEGFEGDLEIIRVGLDGSVKANGKFPAPFVMNRYIEHVDFEDIYIGKSNYLEAPNGDFEIIPYKMP